MSSLSDAGKLLSTSAPVARPGADGRGQRADSAASAPAVTHARHNWTPTGAPAMTARSPQRHQLVTCSSRWSPPQGYDLEEVSVTAAGRRSLIRVTVDGDDGIDLDGIATVSRAVSEALDAAEQDGPAFAGPYVLEVSSPGVDRPLTEPRHWRRALGRLVTVPVGRRRPAAEPARPGPGRRRRRPGAVGRGPARAAPLGRGGHRPDPGGVLPSRSSTLSTEPTDEEV